MPDTPSMIERCAMAAAADYGEDWQHLPEASRKNSGDPDRAQWRSTARAILTAMREPTDRMLDADEDADTAAAKYQGCDPCETYGLSGKARWQAMIDAALEDGR